MSTKQRAPFAEALGFYYAQNFTLKTTKAKTDVLFTQLTGDMNLSLHTGSGIADEAAPFAGDIVTLSLFSDKNNSTGRKVNLTSGFKSPKEIKVPSLRNAKLDFEFDGTAWTEKKIEITE